MLEAFCYEDRSAIDVLEHTAKKAFCYRSSAVVLRRRSAIDMLKAFR